MRDDDLRDELQFHIDMRVQRHVDAGMAQEDAEALALTQFGDMEVAMKGMRRAHMADVGRVRRQGEYVWRWNAAPEGRALDLRDLCDLLDQPDSERHQHDDDRGQSDAPAALVPFEGFFGCHAERLNTLIGRSSRTPYN